MRKREALKIGLIGLASTLIATPAFARSIELKGAGTALWIFLMIGALIILLQLIPAIVLFLSFIGSTTPLVFKKGKKAEGEVLLPGTEPLAVNK